MKKWLIILFSGIGLYLSTFPIFAADLMQVFQKAYVNDPTFQAAHSTFMSNRENIPIARSALLPQITLDAATQYNHEINKSTPRKVRLMRGSKFNYNSNGFELDLTQTVFNWAQWANLREAKASVKSANATYNAAFQSLMSRVSQAFFNVLDAEDNLRFIEAEKAAIYRQLDQAQQQFKVGLVAITGVYQAQADYDNIVAQEIAAQNDIINRREDLRAITGYYYSHLAGLKGDVPLVTPHPNNVEQWVNMSVHQNWTLTAARYNTEVAKQEVNVQRAGHLPIVNAFGNIEQERTGASASGHIKTNTNIVGVELQLPVYEGGFVSASTKKARYDWQDAIDQQEFAYRDAVNFTRQSYNNVIAGISKIKADKQAIVSNKASLESTIEAYKVGTQTMLDVLQAQRQLFDTLRTFANDQYNYINDLISLKEAAGTLNVNDLQKINSWLTEQRRSSQFITTETLQQQSKRKVTSKPLTPREEVKEELSNNNKKKNGNGNTNGNNSKKNANGNSSGNHPKTNTNSNTNGNHLKTNTNGSTSGNYPKTNANGSTSGNYPKTNTNGNTSGNYLKENWNSNNSNGNNNSNHSTKKDKQQSSKNHHNTKKHRSTKV